MTVLASELPWCENNDESAFEVLLSHCFVVVALLCFFWLLHQFWYALYYLRLRFFSHFLLPFFFYQSSFIFPSTQKPPPWSSLQQDPIFKGWDSYGKHGFLKGEVGKKEHSHFNHCAFFLLHWLILVWFLSLQKACGFRDKLIWDICKGCQLYGDAFACIDFCIFDHLFKLIAHFSWPYWSSGSPAR